MDPVTGNEIAGDGRDEMSCRCSDPEEHERRCLTYNRNPKHTPEYGDYLYDQMKDKELEDGCEVPKADDCKK